MPGLASPARKREEHRATHSNPRRKTQIMTDWPVYGTITGPIVMIGFGSIGRGTLPLIERHFTHDPKRFTVIDPEGQGSRAARRARHQLRAGPRDPGRTWRTCCDRCSRRARASRSSSTLSVEVSSTAVMRLAHEVGALYIDTVAEPWPGFYTDTSLSVSQRSNYALREGVLDLKRAFEGKGCHRGQLLRCQSRHGLVVRQAGAAQRCRRLRDRSRRAASARGLGQAGAARRREGHPYRRARHPARRQAEADGHVRQHLVGGRLRLRGIAAGRTRLGHAREGAPGGRPPPRVRAGLRDLPDAAPAPARGCARGVRRHARSTASSSPTTRRSRSPTISPSERAGRSPTARPATTPTAPRTTRCWSLDEMAGCQWRQQARSQILDETEIVDGVDELGVLLYRPRQERLLVRLATVDRGRRGVSRPTRMPPVSR